MCIYIYVYIRINTYSLTTSVNAYSVSTIRFHRSFTKLQKNPIHSERAPPHTCKRLVYLSKFLLHLANTNVTKSFQNATRRW